MARIRTDSDRAALLQSLLDQQAAPDDAGNTPDGPMNTRVPKGAPNQEQIIGAMGGGSPSPDPTIPPAPMQQAPGMQGGNSPIQPIPGQPGMVAVPAALAQQAMQMLMQQGSANATGKAMGANGQAPTPPQEEEEA